MLTLSIDWGHGLLVLMYATGSEIDVRVGQSANALLKPGVGNMTVE